MNTESREIQDDKLAAIGIGAMIVFIALILVAAVAAAVIIQTAEKLQQNAQTTGEDTSDNLAGKLVIHAAFVSTGAPGAPAIYTTDDAYVLYVRLAPGSSAVLVGSITFQFICSNGVIEGTFGTQAGGAEIALLDQGPGALIAATNTLLPGQPYVLWMDADVAGTDCSANNGIDTTIQLYIHVGTGGSTYEVLTIGNAAAGSPVI
mgnify:CR=1 FL=1